MENPVAELRSDICRMKSHSVSCHPTQMNTPCHNLSQIGWYSVYLPQRDRRLSWPRHWWFMCPQIVTHLVVTNW